MPDAIEALELEPSADGGLWAQAGLKERRARFESVADQLPKIFDKLHTDHKLVCGGCEHGTI